MVCSFLYRYKPSCVIHNEATIIYVFHHTLIFLSHNYCFKSDKKNLGCHELLGRIVMLSFTVNFIQEFNIIFWHVKHSFILNKSTSHMFQICLASLETSSHDGKNRAGLMIPIPAFPQYIARIIEYNFHQVLLIF